MRRGKGRGSGKGASVTHLDAVVLVEHTVHELARDVDLVLLVGHDMVQHAQELDDPAPDAESRVRDALAETREVLHGEVGPGDNVLADELDRGVADHGRAVEHAVLDAAADVVLVEEVRVLRDDEADGAEGLGALAHLGRLGRVDDAGEDGLVQVGEGREAPELEGDGVRPRLRVVGTAGRQASARALWRTRAR